MDHGRVVEFSEVTASLKRLTLGDTILLLFPGEYFLEQDHL